MKNAIDSINKIKSRKNRRKKVKMMDNKKIIKALEKLHDRILHSSFSKDVSEEEILALVETVDIINSQPQENAKEIQYGTWEECENQLNKYCTNCGKVNGTIYHKPLFCENCGAYMRGKKEENNNGEI